MAKLDTKSKVEASKLVSKTGRKIFNPTSELVEVPNLIDHQKESFKDFVQEGMAEVLAEMSPISDYTGTKLDLKFMDYSFDEPKISERQARDDNLSFEAPLKLKMELINKVSGEVKAAEIFMGSYPWMTERGSFIVNGTEKVVIGQLIKSPGVLFSREAYQDRYLYSAKISPARGAWIEIEVSAQGPMFVKIDKKRRIPLTTFLRALGYGSDAELIKLFEKDLKDSKVDYIAETLKKDLTKNHNDAVLEVFRKIRPGDLATVANAKGLLDSLLFNFKRFDLGRVGRQKMNRRLGLDKANTTENRVLDNSDILAVIKELIRLTIGQLPADDIDSLANRRVKLVGEMLAKQFRTGFLRMERNIKDKMSLADLETVTPAQLINARPVVMSVREFFNTGQMCQYMDQTNPLAEIAHKRVLSSMGPGGLTKERAGFEVRDPHPTHYGRICVLETPEGPNIGLVLHLATYAKVNPYGFIEAPFRKVKNGVVTDEIEYLDVDGERDKVVASAGSKLDVKNKFIDERVPSRINFEAITVNVDDVTHMDAAQALIIGASAGLIPFIETNDAKRTAIGANQQRQAVPLVKPRAAMVGTGSEHIIAENSGQLVSAEQDGEVISSEAAKVSVKYKNGDVKEYVPQHFIRSNDDMCINQKVVVVKGQKVKKGDPIIEGMSVDGGELALGKDVLVAWMPWAGYNFEDSIVISKRLVQDDEFTSIHIKEYPYEIRETKLGPEQISKDIPNVSEEAFRNLDNDGIVRVGATVKPGDILVGKITPKGETELSGEERLLRAIFGDNSKDVRDSSLRLPNGGGGKVVDVKIFSRENGNDLRSGVIMQVVVYVASMNKVEVGDKFAGRYGNKGVIARILPVEDMPYMEDGTPVDMVLNPMGVPSRMNLGQLFEANLGLAAKALGYRTTSPSFNRVTTAQIREELTKAGYPQDGKVQLIDGRTGQEFKEKTAIGFMHMLKLEHMVSSKIHARSVGPYTMVTQQPLGGKAHNGGQRFGEMEVWALEAYGAANILQEMLTIKSDDIVGRSKAYESLIKTLPLGAPEVPESFRVLTNELRGLALEVELVKNTEDGEVSVSADEVVDAAYSKIGAQRKKSDGFIVDIAEDFKAQTTEANEISEEDFNMKGMGLEDPVEVLMSETNEGGEK